MEALLSFDESLFSLINSGLSNELFDTLLVPLRHKLTWIPLYLFILVFIGVNFGNLKGIAIIGLLLTVALSDTMSSKIIKKSVQRTRPCHIEELAPVKRIPCSPGYSFTSSHATNHFAIGTFLMCLFRFTKKRYLFLVWAGLIAFAQVYVGAHYPLDVICGALLGLLIGGLTSRAYLTLTNSEFIKNTLREVT